MGHQEHRANLRELFKLMILRGFFVDDITGKKHLKYKITAPNGEEFTWVVGTTPSDRRAWLNSIGTLRRWIVNCGYQDERTHLRINFNSGSASKPDPIIEFLIKLESKTKDQYEKR